jgi:hypothetical protein
MFETKKLKIYENFMKEDFIIRILCVTNVMKLDMNILDVNIIIQWKKSCSMRALMQRIDRIAKKSNRLDEFIWFHLVWCKEKRAATSTWDSRFSQLRQIMNINDKFDSKFELNEQKREKQKKKQQLDRKTQMKQRVLMKNDLWRIVNEKICIRKIILAIFDKLDMKNMFFRRYETNCCFHCTKDENFTAKINLCIRSRLNRSRTKTFDYKRKTMKKTLKIWRNKRESNEFIFNYIIDDDDYELFLDNEIIKEIIKNVHLMQTIENFLAISTNWSKDWLNKYVEKLIIFVMHATTNAKKSNRRVITSITNNNISVEDLIIEKANAIEKNDDSAHQDSFVILVIFIIFSAFRIVSILTTSSASSVVTISTTFRVTRKRHEFILKNNDSSLKSRNINFVMREIIIEKMNRSQNSNRSRREAAIKSEIFKKKQF